MKISTIELTIEFLWIQREYQVIFCSFILNKLLHQKNIQPEFKTELKSLEQFLFFIVNPDYLFNKTFRHTAHLYFSTSKKWPVCQKPKRQGRRNRSCMLRHQIFIFYYTLTRISAHNKLKSQIQTFTHLHHLYECENLCAWPTLCASFLHTEGWLKAFFTADTLTGHSWKSMGVINNVTDGSVLFMCESQPAGTTSEPWNWGN